MTPTTTPSDGFVVPRQSAVLLGGCSVGSGLAGRRVGADSRIEAIHHDVVTSCWAANHLSNTSNTMMQQHSDEQYRHYEQQHRFSVTGGGEADV